MFKGERECVCERERECVWERERACVCEREREKERVCERERECVCVCERERECVCVRERERECVCERESVCVRQEGGKAQCWRQWDSCMIMWWLALFAWVLLRIWWCWPGGGAGCGIDSVVLLTSAIAELWPQATRSVHNPPASLVGLGHLELKGQPSVFSSCRPCSRVLQTQKLLCWETRANNGQVRSSSAVFHFKGKRGCYTWITNRQINVIIPV